MNSTVEQAVQTIAATVARIEEQLAALTMRFDTQHMEAQETMRHALANTVALGTWLQERPADNPPPDAGIMDAAAIEAKSTRAGGVLLAPAAPAKKLTKIAYFVECWVKDEDFRAEYANSKAAMAVPKRLVKDTNETYTVKEAKAVHKSLTPEDEARFKVAYASYCTTKP
jgi:hypothetical protein